MAVVPADSVPSRPERIEKAFSLLDSQRALLANCTTGWKELEELFSDLQTTIQRKFDELAQKETEFAAKVEEDKVALSMREETISDREKASLERVQEQKDAAIAALLEEKRKWGEGYQGKGSSNIPATLPLPSVVGTSPLKSDSAVDTKIVATDGQAKSLLADIELPPQLKSLCDTMDAEGLLKYLVARTKESVALSIELRCALQKCLDPYRLVLKAVEGYHDFKLNPNQTGAVSRACILLLDCFSLVLADPVLGVDRPVMSSSVKELAKEVARSWRSKMDIHGDAVNVSPLDAHAFLQLLATFCIGSEYKDELGKLFVMIARRKQAPAICRSLGLMAEIPVLVDKLTKEGKYIEALSCANNFGIMEKIQPVSLLKEYLKEVRVAAHLASKNAPNAIAGQNDAIMKELSAVKAILKAVKDYKLESQFPTDILHKRVEQLEKAKEERQRVAAAAQFLEKDSRLNKKAVKFMAKQKSKKYKVRYRKKPRLNKTAATGFESSAVTVPASVAAGAVSYRKKPRLNAAPGFASSVVTAPAPVAAGVVTTRNNPLHRPSDRGQYGGAFPSQGLSTASNYDRQPQPGFGSAYGAGTTSLAALSSSYMYPSDGIGSAYGSTSAYPTLSGSYGDYQYTSSLAPSSTYQSAPPSAYQAVPPATYQSFTR